MHELGIARSIVAIVGEASKGKPVRRVTLEIGKLSGVMAEAIVFCFDAVARGTVVEGATLEILEIDGLARCEICCAEFRVPGLFAACVCGSRRLTHIAGEELNIKTIVIEEVA
jgi:hydrogenase nickel incorporation protein HypA/HybF